MTTVTELDLPEIDYSTPDFGPENYHGQLAAAREKGWLARSPLAVIVLDAEAADFFLRSRAAAFPGREIAALFGITSGRLYEHIDANILNASGDRHRRLRALIGPALTSRAADRWRPVMRGFLAELWDPHADRCEFVSAVARAYPARTIAAVLGAPDADAARLHYWSNMVQRQFDIQALSTQLPELEKAVTQAHDYVADLVQARREQSPPADDLISAVVQARDEEGATLTPHECVNLVLNVIAGGVDTTQGQLSHALRLFAAHPEQWELLRSDPSLVPAAVQEVLRWEPVAPFTARILADEISHRGVEFPAGTIIAICAERANRDFGDGEAFDITANADARLYTFGVGPHFCVGMNLARAELEEALAFLAPRMPGLALDGPPRLGGVEGIYSVEELPLRWNLGGQ